MFIDTHAHLFYHNYNGELDDVFKRAEEAKVDYILVPSTDIGTAEKTIKLCEKYNIVYGAAGVHPHDTKEWDNNSLKKLEELIKHEKIIAIGEIGLDYYYDYSPKEKQIEAFKAQIELALKSGLPVIIHNRDADEDMMEIISSYCGTGLKAQFHCFNGTSDYARELIKQHHFISFTGNITFKKADELKQVLRNVNPEHLLLETDSPFMTPVPHRGKRNEPAFVKLIAEKIAEVYNLELEDVGRITSFNAFRMFGLGSLPEKKFTYKIGNALYINITNRCNAHCVFCPRKEEPFLKGYNLKLDIKDEPPAETYMKEIGDPKKYSEIVFCGFGEPTIRWDVVKQVAAFVKDKNGKTRLNTNGHGNVINKRDITADMQGIFDEVSVSLNTSDPKQYSEIMQLEPEMFNEAVEFCKKAGKYVGKVTASVVSINNLETQKIRKFVEEDLKAELKIREYF